MADIQPIGRDRIHPQRPNRNTRDALGTALLPDFVGVGPIVEEPNRGDRQHPNLSSARRTEGSFFRRFVDPAFTG